MPSQSSAGALFGRSSWVCLLQGLQHMLCTSIGSGDTWTQRFVPSWHNISLWIKERGLIMFPTGTSNDRSLLKNNDGLGRMQPPLEVCHQSVSLKFFVLMPFL